MTQITLGEDKNPLSLIPNLERKGPEIEVKPDKEMKRIFQLATRSEGRNGI